MNKTEHLLKLLGSSFSSASPKSQNSASAPVVNPPVIPATPRLEGAKSLMAKIAETIRPNAAQRLAKEQGALADLEREIAELRTAQAGKLLDEDPAEAVKLAEKITFAERRLGVVQQRIAALQKQTRRETVDRRQQEKDAALADFEKKLTGKAAAGVRVDNAIAEFTAALAAYRETCRAPFEVWPATFPPMKLFEGYAYSYAESRIAGALHMNSGAAVELFAALPRRLGSIAEKDIQIAASIIEDIRNAPLPKQHEEAA